MRNNTKPKVKLALLAEFPVDPCGTPNSSLNPRAHEEVSCHRKGPAEDPTDHTNTSKPRDPEMDMILSAGPLRPCDSTRTFETEASKTQSSCSYSCCCFYYYINYWYSYCLRYYGGRANIVGIEPTSPRASIRGQLRQSPSALGTSSPRQAFFGR